MTGIPGYSSTASSNSTIAKDGGGTHPISNSMDPDTLDDVFRQIMADARSLYAEQDKSATYTIIATDLMMWTRFTATATANLTAAATLGDKFRCIIQADGGAVTIDPNSSETINGAATLALADGEWAVLQCDGSGWRALKSGGGALSLAGGQMTGTLKEARGADIASATALTLGSDGNSFDVTGTTAITSINTVGVGTVVRLQFDGILTLTHHATDLILPGGGDITTAAGDVAVFYEYASGHWRCVSYTKADGAAVVVTEAQIKSALDGATLTSVTPADNDEILIQDTSDSGNLKTVSKSDLASNDYEILHEQTASSDASISFDSTYITGTNDIYILWLVDVLPATDGVTPQLLFSSDNGSSYLSSYARSGHAVRDDGTGANLGNNAASVIPLGGYHAVGNQAGEGINGCITFMKPTDAATKTQGWAWLSYYDVSGYQDSVWFGFQAEVAAAHNNIKIQFSSGNIASGTLRLCKVK